MAHQSRRKGRSARSSALYGFGALGVKAVKLKDVQETWGNPNLDTKPLAEHAEPMKTARSFQRQKLSTIHPNYKYSKPKRRRRKKKKQTLTYYPTDHPVVDHVTHPPPKKLISPLDHNEYKRSIRPSSATLVPQTPRGLPSSTSVTHDITLRSQDAESIQMELMREHMEGMKQLKQEIASQMKRNQSHNQIDTLKKDKSHSISRESGESINSIQSKIVQQEEHQDDEASTSTSKTKSLKKTKEEILIPLPELPIPPHVTVHVDDRTMALNPNLKNAIIGSPQRPRHQSFQRPPDSGGSRPIFDVVMTKRKKKKPIKPSPKHVRPSSVPNKDVHLQKMHKINRKKPIRRKRGNRKSHYHANRQYVYHSHHHRPTSKQSKLHQVMVGNQPIIIEDRFSSTFASNTPRITPLNKLYDNPIYKKYREFQNLQQSAQSASRKKKKVKPKRTRPSSCRPKVTKKPATKRKQKTKSRVRSRKRPQSAPAVSSRNQNRPQKWDIKQYMKSIAKNGTDSDSEPDTKNGENATNQQPAWNPFDGITMFELQYLVSFLRSQQREYQISPETLDVLDKCLHFYVNNDSYETAWNAWNIIQKFLLPDNSQLDIDKNLCREVLGEYQTQSRDLKHNHIHEALFDQVIQEIGTKIAQNIPDRQQFTIEFEKYVIQIQQSSHLEAQKEHIPPHLAQRPKSAICTGSNTKDLVHCGTNGVVIMNRPQSALPVSTTRSQPKDVNDSDDVDVLHQLDEETNDGTMKYCLDGIIDEM